MIMQIGEEEEAKGKWLEEEEEAEKKYKRYEEFRGRMRMEEDVVGEEFQMLEEEAKRRWLEAEEEAKWK